MGRTRSHSCEGLRDEGRRFPGPARCQSIRNSLWLQWLAGGSSVPNAARSIYGQDSPKNSTSPFDANWPTGTFTVRFSQVWRSSTVYTSPTFDADA